MRKKNKYSFKLIFLILLMFSIFGTVTYGLIVLTQRQTGDNVVSASCFKTTFTEGTSINLSVDNNLALPMSDSDGLNTTPYTFTVTNTCNLTSNYYVILSTKGTFSDSNIKYSLNNSTPSLLNTAWGNSIYEKSIGYTNSYVLDHGTLTQNSSYQGSLQVWIDSNATYDSEKTTWEGELKVVSDVKEYQENLYDSSTLASYLKGRYENSLEQYLYLHSTDSTLYKNNESSYSGYSTSNAGDGSYRYSGPSASVNNYVCFGTTDLTTCKNDTSNYGTSKYLYRIIGVFGDNVKIIMNNPLYNTDASTTTFQWDKNNVNTWSSSYLKKFLNGEELPGKSETLSGTGTSTKIGGTSLGTSDASMTYNTVTKTLDAGNYDVIFSYRKDGSDNSGTDAGYVRNLTAGSATVTVTNDTAYPWTSVNGGYKSSTQNKHNTTTNLTYSFTLTSSATLSFEWSVSSESASYDYIYYTINKTTPGDISSNSYINMYDSGSSTTWKGKIASYMWRMGSNSTYSTTLKSFYTTEQIGSTVSAQVGIMSVSDFGYAASPKYWSNIQLNSYSSTKNDNWLATNTSNEWTINKHSSNYTIAYYLYSSGYPNSTSAQASYLVRPSIYLVSSTTVTSGDGSSTNPYMIN